MIWRALGGTLVILLLAFLIGVLLLKADPRTFPQQLIGGVLLGSIYALIALGYTMVYGVLRLINFAHGEVFMLGAYTSLLTSWLLGYGSGTKLESSSALNLGILLVASMVVCGLVGVLIEVLAYRPMRKQPRIASLITAIGVSLLLQYGGALVLPVAPPPNVNEKVNPFRGALEVNIIPPSKELTAQLSAANQKAAAAVEQWDQAKRTSQPEAAIKLLRDAKNDAEREQNRLEGEVEKSAVRLRTPNGQLVMFGTTMVLMGILTYLVMFTSVGRAMRAVSHDFDSASLMGINVSRIVSITFLIGSMLAGAGAMMNATFLSTPLTTQFGVMPGVKAFVAAVLGGIGNIPGAVLGGLLMGVAENLVIWVGYGNYKDAIAFVILIVVLLFKPGGLLGSAKVEKV